MGLRRLWCSQKREPSFERTAEGLHHEAGKNAQNRGKLEGKKEAGKSATVFCAQSPKKRWISERQGGENQCRKGVNPKEERDIFEMQTRMLQGP